MNGESGVRRNYCKGRHLSRWKGGKVDVVGDWPVSPLSATSFSGAASDDLEHDDRNLGARAWNLTSLNFCLRVTRVAA